MAIRQVIFNDPATIVIWYDRSKTVVKCGEGEVFDPEKGLAMSIAKRALGDKGRYYKTFKKWLPKEESSEDMDVIVRPVASLKVNEKLNAEEECSDSVQKAIDNIKKHVRETLGGIYNIEQEEEKKYTAKEIMEAFGFSDKFTKYRLKQYEESRQ